MDFIANLAARLAPSKLSKPSTSGIGIGHGMVPVDDDVSLT